jgi:uncharacterized membrane protein
VHAKWTFIPVGPAVVLTLFVIFLASYVAGHRASRSQRRSRSPITTPRLIRPVTTADERN